MPEARFRGPEADRSVRLVPREERQRFEGRVRSWVRDENVRRGMPETRPGQDAIGNLVPRDTRFLDRRNVTNINIHYTQIVNNFGRPGHSYLFTPRGAGDYWNGYWDGYADGYGAWHRHRHHSLIVINFYYPFYFSDPYFFAFYYEGYYPAAYTYFGWSPSWIYPSRVYYAPAEYYYTPVTPYRYYQGYYQGGSDLDYAGAEQAIGDIRQAWINADIGPIASHLTDKLDIRVYFDGEYSYTTSTDDFYAMTLDTLATTQTAAMDFDEPIWVTSNEVFYTGRQVFYDPDGARHTVYVSFRLRHLGADWYLVAIGTSNDPIQHQYRDFRN
jgi:hypothetical protein